MTTLDLTYITCGVFLIALFVIPFIRRTLISAPLMRIVGRALPVMGETERIALEAGTVGWDGEIFSGKPNWSKLLNFKIQPLSIEEQAFIDGPLEELCGKLDDWQITQDRDLPPYIWQYLKTNKFLGLIIPKKYGGLGFSAHAHSAIVTKLSSRSVTAAVTVMVPNSLGPGELLLHYGTDAQKDHYLPRLASGEDIPCFALTEPEAGSDAASGQSFGVVCNGIWGGKDIVGIKLTFNKRYITLAPVAGVIGLAFRLFDPDHKIGEIEDIGITCALLPRSTPGLKIGNRHDPMGIPFQNGPVHGENVFVPLDYIIGGPTNAGTGWKMLMESLAAGRSISLPSQALSAAELAIRATSAYGAIREQFGMPIGKFEGVKEKTARIAGHAYFMNAARRLAFGAVDAGEKPSVISAIVKAYLTEGARVCINDAMDIHAGAAICRGPANIFSRPYNAIPIGITVEGANILTRSLIIFGQGAIRCHPYVLKEMEAIKARDVKGFDHAFFGHIAHSLSTALRAFITGLTGGVFLTSPLRGKEACYYRQINRSATIFALIADISLATLGGSLKRKEYLSGRLSDAFSWLFLTTATLKHFNDCGRPENQRPLLNWTCIYAQQEIELALLGVLENLPNRVVARVTYFIAFPFGRKHRPLTDKQIDAVVDSLNDESLREHITADVYIPSSKEAGLGQAEAAYTSIKQTTATREKLTLARRDGRLKKASTLTMAAKAVEIGVISRQEYHDLLASESLRSLVIRVSDYDPDIYKGLS